MSLSIGRCNYKYKQLLYRLLLRHGFHDSSRLQKTEKKSTFSTVTRIIRLQREFYCSHAPTDDFMLRKHSYSRGPGYVRITLVMFSSPSPCSVHDFHERKSTGSMLRWISFFSRLDLDRLYRYVKALSRSWHCGKILFRLHIQPHSKGR